MQPASGGKFDFKLDNYSSLYQNLLDNCGIMRGTSELRNILAFDKTCQQQFILISENGGNDITMLVFWLSFNLCISRLLKLFSYFKDFKHTTVLYALSVDGDLCNLYHTHSGKSGTIDFNVSLKEATEKSYTLIVYKVFNKNLTIDGDRNCNVTDA